MQLPASPQPGVEGLVSKGFRLATYCILSHTDPRTHWKIPIYHLSHLRSSGKLNNLLRSHSSQVAEPGFEPISFDSTDSAKGRQSGVDGSRESRRTWLLAPRPPTNTLVALAQNVCLYVQPAAVSEALWSPPGEPQARGQPARVPSVTSQ